MSPPDRWTLADVAAHYAQHPELRRTDQATMPQAQPTDGAGACAGEPFFKNASPGHEDALRINFPPRGGVEGWVLESQTLKKDISQVLPAAYPFLHSTFERLNIFWRPIGQVYRAVVFSSQASLDIQAFFFKAAKHFVSRKPITFTASRHQAQQVIRDSDIANGKQFLVGRHGQDMFVIGGRVPTVATWSCPPGDAIQRVLHPLCIQVEVFGVDASRRPFSLRTLFCFSLGLDLGTCRRAILVTAIMRPAARWTKLATSRHKRTSRRSLVPEGQERVRHPLGRQALHGS